MQKDNKRVPIAILSCFLIAFILQGTLKMCGVFIFEKALNWSVFEAIDNSKWLQIIYYSIIVFIAQYCLSFTLTRKCYSKKWYHYLILGLSSIGVTTLKCLVFVPIQYQFVIDVLLFIGVPLAINFTTDAKNRMFSHIDLTSCIITIAVQILLYFAYLGLNYWSALLASLIPATQMIVYASANFLIQFELYIGLILLMLSVNFLIDKLKDKEVTMFYPINIASKKAKLTAKKDKLLKEIAKIDEELASIKDE